VKRLNDDSVDRVRFKPHAVNDPLHHSVVPVFLPQDETPGTVVMKTLEQKEVPLYADNEPARPQRAQVEN
jgi:hypothetical protein